MTVARRSNESRCAICGRASGADLCRYHREGAERLLIHYEVWRERTGTAWGDYLRAIMENELAGEWVKESAAFLLKKEVTGQRGPPA